MLFRQLARSALIATAATAAMALTGSALAAPTGAPATRPGGQETAQTAQQVTPQLAQQPRRTKTLFGATAQRLKGESLAQAINRQDKKYGHLDSMRMFFSGLPASWKQIRKDAGSRPLVLSFKAKPSAVVAGDHDRFFRHWFANAPSDRRIWWSFWHEPEDDIERNAFTATQYRAAWNHLSALADRAHNKQLRATLVLMCWTAEKNSHRKWRNYYSASAVQVLSWDCYNAGYKQGNYRTPQSLFENIVTASRRANRPFGISELGSVLATGDGHGRARGKWLRAVSGFLRHHHARFVTYFDSNIGVEFRLLDKPSRSAWRHSVSGR